jgi:hypothetical protein
MQLHRSAGTGSNPWPAGGVGWGDQDCEAVERMGVSMKDFLMKNKTAVISILGGLAAIGREKTPRLQASVRSSWRKNPSAGNPRWVYLLCSGNCSRRSTRKRV